MITNKFTNNRVIMKFTQYFMIMCLIGSFFSTPTKALSVNSSTTSTPLAEFNMIYKANEKSYIVNNSVLPDNIGNNLPYSIHCTNLSKSAHSYDWQIRTPGHDYVHVDNTPNPIIKINNYGPTYIKLIINGNDSLYKEYCVSAKEYGFTSKIETSNIEPSNDDNNKYAKNHKNVVKSFNTYISPNNEVPKVSMKIPYDKNYSEKSDFKISYQENNRFFNVTNNAIPNTINNLPYKVTLTNITNTNANLAWFIQLPDSNEYTWMSDKQNAVATINTYGKVKFKLILNAKESTATEYSVTAFPWDKQIELKSLLKNTPKTNSIKPNFKIIYSLNSYSQYDVTNSVIPDNPSTLPYEISLLNLSNGEKSYDFSIKQPGSSEYTPLNDLKATINNYGDVTIRLRLNDDDSLINENHLVSYFSTDNSNISNQNFHPDASWKNTKADFKILAANGDKWNDVTNSQIEKDNLNEPQSFHLTNLSTNNNQDEWFIKFPGGQYIPFDNVPNPIALDWQPGIVYFKLRINGDDNQTKEYFVKVCSKYGSPTITTPENGIEIESGDLSIKWNEYNKDFSYILTLTNETKRQPIIKDKLIKGQNSHLVPAILLEEGCQYSIKITCKELELDSTSMFYTNGTLSLLKKPIGGNSTNETAVNIKSASNVISQLNKENCIDYFKFDNPTNSELSIGIESAQYMGISIDLFNENNNLEGKAKQDKNGKLSYSKILRNGSYYLKVYSNENLNDQNIKYNLNLKRRTYNPKAVLLYVGYGFRGDRTAKYPTYSDADLEKMFNNGTASLNTKEFIINTACDSYGAHQGIPKEFQEELINSVKIEDQLGSKTLGEIKEQLRNYLNEYIDTPDNGKKTKSTTFIPYYMTLESFADDSIALAVKLIRKDPNVKIWFTFPLPISSNLIDQFTMVYKEKIVDGIKGKLNDINPDYWRNNVVGFYYAHEDIPIGYTIFDTKDNAYLKTNPVVKSMAQLSDIVHNKENKLFMWIPCSQKDALNIERIGYIANRTDFFDYCIIQPNRLFCSSEYASKGIGDDEILILNDLPEAGKDIKVKVDCKTGQSLKVKVLDGSKWIAFNKEVQGQTSMEFSFKPWRELYTIIATVTDNGTTKTFFKTIFPDYHGKTELNIPTILKAIKKNCVYYPGTNGLNGKSVLTKTSKTKIGFEMEIDGYCNLDYTKIDFTNSDLASLNNVDAVADLPKETISKIVSARTSELNNYFKYMIEKKSSWYKEYLRAYQKYVNHKPVAFYVGDRNELFDGTSEDYMDISDDVFNSVSNFFRKN